MELELSMDFNIVYTIFNEYFIDIAVAFNLMRSSIDHAAYSAECM